MGKDWFTKYTLAEALHIRAEEVERWISLGWLKCRVVQTGNLQRQIIEADDFSEFCKAHSREIVGRRLNLDRLNFVKNFVFPPSHAELLPVRESKKERAAYEERLGRSPRSDIDDEYDDDFATNCVTNVYRTLRHSAEVAAGLQAVRRQFRGPFQFAALKRVPM